jgi:hypothetical protein
MLERHHLRLSAEELWESWSASRKSGHKGDILHAYTGIGYVYLEEHKPEGLWIVKPCWEIARYVARTEQRAIHLAVLSFLRALRYSVREFIYLAKVKVNDDANEEMCDLLDLLSPNEEETEEYSYE